MVSVLVTKISAMSMVLIAGIIMLIFAFIFRVANMEFEVKEETENTESENKELVWN